MHPLLLAVVALVIAAAMVGVFVKFRSPPPGQRSDQSVLTQLKAAGSDLSKPHELEFFLYAPSEAAAARVASKLTSQGLHSTVKPPTGTSSEWLILVTRTMLPELNEITRLGSVFSQVTATEGGQYDGWGSPVVK